MRSLFKKNRFLFAFVTLIVFATNVNLGPAAQARELRRVQEEAILLLFKQAVTEVNSLESISSLIDKLPLHLRDYAREVFYRSFPANHATQIIPEAKEWVQPVYKEILEKAGSFLLGPLGYSVAQKGYWRIIRPAQKILTDQLKPVSELLLPPLSTLPKVHYRNGTIDVDDLAFDLVWSDNRLALYSKEKDVAIDLNEASIKLKDPLLAIPFIEDLAQKISLEKVGHLKDIFGTSKAYAFGMDPVSLASIVAVALLLMILKVLIIAAILTIALPLYADYSARPDHFVADQLTRERLRDEDFFQKTVRNLDTVVQDGKRKYSGEEYRREIISECHEILQAHFAGAFSEEASTYYARVLYILSRYSDDPHSLEVIDSFQKEAEPWVRGEEREQLLSCIQRAGAEIELRSQAVQR